MGNGDGTVLMSLPPYRTGMMRDRSFRLGIPSTPDAKLDRSALPKPDMDNPIHSVVPQHVLG
jgi:hypothetical protein